jgi:hypothetical protein
VTQGQSKPQPPNIGSATRKLCSCGHIATQHRTTGNRSCHWCECLKFDWKPVGAGSESGRGLPSAEQLAQMFHESYERLAPSFGYVTSRTSAKPWGEVPELNRKLMIAVCAEVRAALQKEG